MPWYIWLLIGLWAGGTAGNETNSIKKSLILAFLIISGIFFSPTGGNAQMRIAGGGYGEDSGLYSGQSARPGGMMGPGRVDNSPDGGRFVITHGYRQLPKPLDKDQAGQD